MPILPLLLLENVSWSFAEPTPLSPEALRSAAQAYAAEVGVPDPSAQLARQLPFSDVRLRYSYGLRGESGEWVDKTSELRVVAPPAASLTGTALLWELHVACQSTVGENDHHFFEGLELVSPAEAGDPATYEVLLGS